MKGKKILGVTVVALLSMTLMAGCGDNSREKALEDQVSQLEQQVTDLQNSQNIDAGKNDTADTTADDAEDTEDQTDNGSDTADNSGQNTKTIPSLEELTSSVKSVTDKVNAAAPTGTDDEQLAQYRTLKQEIDSIDRDLDYWDDDVESQFEQGKLTREEYRTKDRAIDALEDQLDDSEDDLENLFGIDD